MQQVKITSTSDSSGSVPVVPEEVRRILAETYSTQAQRGRVKTMVLNTSAGEDIARVVTDADLLHEIKALLAATPSKPVGDGPEASAPPAGGGADLRMLQQAAKAGRLRIKCRERPAGADPDAGMTWPIEVELPCINGLSAWFTLGNIYSPDRAAQGYTDGALNDDLARSFAAHIVKSLAAPAAPEPPAGGAGWCFDMEAAPRDGTLLLCVEYDDPARVVDVHWFKDGRGSWRGGFGQLRRPIAWRLLPAPPAIPANAGAEGGQHADH